MIGFEPTIRILREGIQMRRWVRRGTPPPRIPVKRAILAVAGVFGAFFILFVLFILLNRGPHASALSVPAEAIGLAALMTIVTIGLVCLFRRYEDEGVGRHKALGA